MRRFTNQAAEILVEFVEERWKEDQSDEMLGLIHKFLETVAKRETGMVTIAEYKKVIESAQQQIILGQAPEVEGVYNIELSPDVSLGVMRIPKSRCDNEILARVCVFTEIQSARN